MNERLRKFARESHIDVYALGKDRAKWEATLEKFAQMVVEDYVSNMENEVAVLKNRVKEMEREKCVECNEPADWMRCTQFAGNHPYCDAHAKLESDFNDSDSYLYWTELKNETLPRL